MRKATINVSYRFGVLLVVTLAYLGVGRAEEETVHTYVGAQKCGMCHKSKKKGDQLGVWAASAHARAYETLKSEKAIEYGKERGVEKPYEADACLKCHVTGHGEPAERFADSFVKEQGVQCESCHGAGSDYKSIKIMKNREAAIAAGLMIPTAETCVRCHNEESPGYTGFDYEEYFAKIAHPNPLKNE